jgi:hypothetical protein
MSTGIPITNLDYEEVFWYGTVFRMYNAGMNPDVVSPENNYYDYLLTFLPWEQEYLALVNVTLNNHKRGQAYGGLIPVHARIGKCVTRLELEKYLGPVLSDWYLLEKK